MDAGNVMLAELGLLRYMLHTGQSRFRVEDKLIEIQDGRLVLKMATPRIQSSPRGLSAPRTEPPSVPTTSLSSQPRIEPDEPTDSPEQQCSVCMENKKVIAGGRCGHRLCMSCSTRITETIKLCPECRKPWMDLLRVY